MEGILVSFRLFKPIPSCVKHLLCWLKGNRSKAENVNNASGNSAFALHCLMTYGKWIHLVFSDEIFFISCPQTPCVYRQGSLLLGGATTSEQRDGTSLMEVIFSSMDQVWGAGQVRQPSSYITHASKNQGLKKGHLYNELSLQKSSKDIQVMVQGERQSSPMSRIGDGEWWELTWDFNL